MVDPEPEDAPEIPPIIVPIVHAKPQGAEAVSAIFGLAPLQVFAVSELVIVGVGFTVTVIG
jgi:hypothetical protein